MIEQDIFNVTVIGTVPAGLYSAFYSGLREMKTKIIEYQRHWPGNCMCIRRRWFGMLEGEPPILGAKLIEQLVEQGLTFNPEVVLKMRSSIIKEFLWYICFACCFWKTALYENNHHRSWSGILNPMKLNTEGAERFEVSNLNYTVKSLMYFKDKSVIISGGGNSAIDWANRARANCQKGLSNLSKGFLERP